MPNTVAKTMLHPQPAPAAPTELQSDPLVLNRYRVVEHRASGGFATVDVCWDTRLRRRVAIKRIPLGTADGPAPWQTVREALNESRTSALLAHPNIVTVFDFEYDDQFAYIVMEYVDGVTLAELLARVEDGRLTPNEAAHVLDALANALAYAHENGVLHLDIKPANVMIDRSGTVKLGDFGMATLASAAGWGGARGGTVGYMSPEQLTGEYVDERSDIFSLATVTYEMLTGDKPFAAPTAEKSLKLIEGGITPLGEVNPDVGLETSDVVDAALSSGPIARPQSVGAFADAALAGLGDAQQGRASVRALMGQVEEEDEEEVEQWRAAKRAGRPARRTAPWILPLAERLVCAATIGFASWLLAPPLNLPQPYGSLALADALALAAGAFPALGTALVLVQVVVSAGASAGGSAVSFPLAVGLAFSVGLWFVSCGRYDRLAGPALLAPSVLGVPTAGAALAGYGCTPVVALVTGATSVLLAHATRALISTSFSAADATMLIGQSMTMPSTWIIAAGCGLGAWLASLLYAAGHPVRTAFGQVLCALACIGGLALGAYVENGGAWARLRMDAVAIAVSFAILMALTGMLAKNATREEERA